MEHSSPGRRGDEGTNERKECESDETSRGERLEIIPGGACGRDFVGSWERGGG